MNTKLYRPSEPDEIPKSNGSSETSSAWENIQTDEVVQSSSCSSDPISNELRSPLLASNESSDEDLDFFDFTYDLNSEACKSKQISRPIVHDNDSYSMLKRNYQCLSSDVVDFPVERNWMQIKRLDKVPRKKHGLPLFDRDFRIFKTSKSASGAFTGYLFVV